MKGHCSILNPVSRALAGITATVVEIDTGELEVIVLEGYHATSGVGDARTIDTQGRSDLARVLVDDLRSREGRWRVRTISTPDTIIADLRVRHVGVATPEVRMLSALDAMDMIEGADA